MSNNPQIFDRALICQRRARFAQQITDYDFLLRHVAQDFSDRLSFVLRTFERGLDFGAHHGLIGQNIRQLENVGEVIALDSCSPLLAQCKRPCVIANEEVLPFRDACFDLIVSGLSLQFVNDLPGTLLQLRRALKPDGLLLASLIGGRTLWELREAFTLAEEETLGGISPRVAPFADVRDCGHLLQRAGFALPVTDVETLTVNYESVFKLMQDLRHMGAANALVHRVRAPLKRQTLFRMVEIYQSKFGLENGKIPATFDILTLTAWGPDQNQQKPLRPGSAKTKLADALGTDEKPLGEKAYPHKKI